MFLISIMPDRDYYDTINTDSEGIYKEKGSKFMSYACQVSSTSEVEDYLRQLKAMHPKSRHICYAYSIGIERDIFRMNDDGEPSGTAGKPIYGELLSNALDNVLIAVVRYFGGTKLGASGLIRAYKAAAHDAILNSEKIRVYETDQIQMFYPIEKMGIMFNLVKSIGIENIESRYGEKPSLVIYTRKSKTDKTIKLILAKYHGYTIDDITDDFESKDISFIKA